MLNLLELLAKALGRILPELFGVLFDTLKKGGSSIQMKRDRPYGAQFQSPRKILKRRHKGFCINGELSASTQDSFRNAFAIGGTGSGKSTVCIIPTLLRIGAFSSTCTHDPSGEVLAAVAGDHAANGIEVKVLNYAKPEASEGYNPLHRVHTVDEAAMIAEICVEASLGKNGKDAFWNSAASELIKTVIGLLLSGDPQYKNMYNVARILDTLAGRPELIDRLVARVANNQLYESYRAFLATPDRLQQNILATARTAVRLFTNRKVALATGHDTLDFESFRKNPTALFIQNNTLDISFYAPLTTILLRQLMEHLMRTLPGADDLPYWFLLDEFASLGRGAGWPVLFSNCRKHQIGILAAIQSISQLENNFGRAEADTILANAYSKLFFTGQPLSTAQNLSQAMGKYEFEDSEGRHRVRSLMTAQEIMQMPRDVGLLQTGHHPPMLLKLKPFYLSSLRKRVHQPAPEVPSILPWDDVPLLPLDYDNTLDSERNENSGL